MAATRLIALHSNKGWTVTKSLCARTDYAMNPEKTEKGKLVTAFGCDPMTVNEEFMLQKRQFEHFTGRKRRDNIIAYQIRQSFKPGEISPEKANRLGRETAMRFTKGQYSFIVATHTDKAHIHNHIVFNSVSIDGTKRFRDFWLSGLALQKVSDLVCLENGLSVITSAPFSERAKRTVYPQRATIRDIICQDIDTVLKKGPKDFQSFLEMMSQTGYTIKQTRHIALKGKTQKRFIRMSSLGNGYTEADIHDRLHGDSHKPQKTVDLLIDIQSKMQCRGPGYVRWATVYNLKQMSKTLLYLRDHGIDDLEQLKKLIAAKTNERDELLASIQKSEQRLSEIAALKTHIINYSKTRNTYEEYRKAGYSRKFFEEHREEITLHRAAKAAFDELNVKRIPKIKDLTDEYARILSKKKAVYTDYRKVKTVAQDLLTVEQNIITLYSAEKTNEQEVSKTEKQHG